MDVTDHNRLASRVALRMVMRVYGRNDINRANTHILVLAREALQPT